MADLMDVLGPGVKPGAEAVPADTAQKPGGGKEMVITVNGDGSFMLDGETMSGDELLKAVEALVGGASEEVDPAAGEQAGEPMAGQGRPMRDPADLFGNPKQFSKKRPGM